MLIMGSGYSTVTPVINQVPSIFGYSEVLSDPQHSNLLDDVGRMTLLSSARDYQSDDIYLVRCGHRAKRYQNQHQFIRYAGYVPSKSRKMPHSRVPPSSRFPVISGNGRYVFFSSDAWGNEGLAFITSNQFPPGLQPCPGLCTCVILKTMTLTEEDVVSSVRHPLPKHIQFIPRLLPPGRPSLSLRMFRLFWSRCAG